MHERTTLERALLESPDNVRLWLLYGQSCVNSKALREARKAYDKAIALAPEEPEAMLGIARVLFAQNKVSEAAIRTQCILEEHPGFAPAHLLLAQVHLSEGQAHLASEHYEMAKNLSKAVCDKEIEKQLAIHLPVPDLGFDGEFGEQPKITANSGWEGTDEYDFDIPDFMDDELAEIEGNGVEQEEFPFVEEEDLGFIEEFERPKGKFSDVAGLDDVKDELLMKLVHPYEYQDLFRTYAKKPGGGLLLHGPPGCGKSLVCRALAGETDAAFYTLRLYDILEMYIGCSEKNLHTLFQTARENAPAVIFIDELDAIGGDRADMRQNAARPIVNQFLMELDGYDGANEGVLVIAATSAIWNVDPAFLRPGRFDRRIYVPSPDEASRAKIFELQAKNRPVDSLDYELLASKTPDYSGADIAQVFDVAVEDALRLAMKKKGLVPLTTEMLLSAIDRVEPTVAIWTDYQDRRNGSSDDDKPKKG